MPQVAERLSNEGYVTLRFDYRGFGESEGPRHRLIPLEQIEDIRNGLTFLGTRDEVDPERLAIWGTSFGGAHATYAAAVDDRVRCIVSVVGVGDGERWLRCLRREWEWQAFLNELEEDRDQRVRTGQSRRVHPYHIMETTPEGWEFWKETVAANPIRGEVEMPLECADAIIEYKPETVAHEMDKPRPVRVRRARRPDPPRRADQPLREFTRAQTLRRATRRRPPRHLQGTSPEPAAGPFRGLVQRAPVKGGGSTMATPNSRLQEER